MLDFSESNRQYDLKSFIETECIASIDLKFCDLPGNWRHMTLPAGSISKDILKHGIGVDGSSVPKFADVNNGDICIVPDLCTGFVDDAFDRPCLSFICDVHDSADNSPHYADPRGAAKRAVEYLRSFDAADEINFLPELEYYLFDRAEYLSGEDEAYWRLASYEGSHKYPDNQESGGCDCAEHARWKIPEGKGYIVTPPFDAYLNLRDHAMERLNNLGIDVKYHHHETGSHGQQELEFCARGLLETADNVLLGKYVIRLVASEAGLRATFMPKPFPNKAGNGMHFHMYLRKNGKTVSYAKDGYSGLSKTALSFIAGVLVHGRALMAITSASTNSYRRLKPGFETPTSFFFSTGNREAAIRIPGYIKDPDEKRWEFRPSDATGNPYLSLSAILMAGLDGIEKDLDPTKEGFGPYDGPGPELKRVPRNLKKLLPATFSEALQALDADHDFLLKGNVFSEDLINTYISYKYDNEIAAIQGQPHPYEFELYFNL